MRDALTTIGPLTDATRPIPSGATAGRSSRRRRTSRGSPTSRRRCRCCSTTRRGRPGDPPARRTRRAGPRRPTRSCRLIVDAHAMRRYYERPEQPQQAARQEPDPDAPPTPRPDRPEHDFHARVGSFGSTPALLRRLGLAVDVVLDGLDAAGARAALAGATWVSVTVTSPRRRPRGRCRRGDAVIVDGDRVRGEVEQRVGRRRAAARRTTTGSCSTSTPTPPGSSSTSTCATSPASTPARPTATRRRRRPARCARPGSPSPAATGRPRSAAACQEAEKLAADDGTRELLLDDLVRGIRVEVWDDVTGVAQPAPAPGDRHRRGEPAGVACWTTSPDIGFLQLSALTARPASPTKGYYLHEVVAGWDGWSLSAPAARADDRAREPPGPDGATEVVVDAAARRARSTARTRRSRVEPASLPRLRYGHVVQLPGARRWTWPATRCRRCRRRRRRPMPPDGPAVDAARAHLERLRSRTPSATSRALPQARRAKPSIEHLRTPSGRRVVRTARRAALRRRAHRRDARRAWSPRRPASSPTRPPRSGPSTTSPPPRASSPSRARPLRVRPQLRSRRRRVRRALAATTTSCSPTSCARPARADRHHAAARTCAGSRSPRRPSSPGTSSARGSSPRAWSSAAASRRAGPDTVPTSERHVAPPKATQLEAETAGRFDTAIGTGDAAEIRRLYAIALAERGTLLDQFVPSLTDPRTPPGAAGHRPRRPARCRPGSTTGRRWRRSPPTAAGRSARASTSSTTPTHCGCRTCPTRTPTASRWCSTRRARRTLLPEPRALQAVTVPYPGDWPSCSRCGSSSRPATTLGARVDRARGPRDLPPGEQVRVAMSSTVRRRDLDYFGLWRSHLASVVDPADGYTTDEVVAAAALMRAAASGWTWWLTPSVDVRLVHAVPAPVRPPSSRR